VTPAPRWVFSPDNVVEIIAKFRPYVNEPGETSMIRIGVAGWDYPDWAGIVYPAPLPRRFDRLSCVAAILDVVEVNVTFYRPVDPKTSRSWATRVPSDSSFLFTAKLHRAFTHDRSYDLDAPAGAYLAGVEPLRRSGRLG